MNDKGPQISSNQAHARLQQLRTWIEECQESLQSSPTPTLQEFQEKHLEFYKDCPTLFRIIFEKKSTQIPELQMMLSKFETVANDTAEYYDASVGVGQYLVDKYVKDTVP